MATMVLPHLGEADQQVVLNDAQEVGAAVRDRLGEILRNGQPAGDDPAPLRDLNPAPGEHAASAHP